MLVLGDPDTDLPALIAELGRQGDFDVTLVRSAEAGIAKLSGAHFDAILLDMSVPGAARLSLVARSRGEMALVPILALSDNLNALSFEKAFRSGADDAVALEAGAILSRLTALPEDSALKDVQPRGEALVADSDRARCDVVARILTHAGYQVKFAADALAARFYLTKPKLTLVVIGGDVGELRSMVEDARRKGNKAKWVFSGRPDDLPGFHEELKGLGGVATVSAFGPPENVLYLANELSADAKEDNRDDERLLYGTFATFRPADGGEAEPAFTYNVSREGLYIRTLAPPSADRLLVVLRPPNSDRTVELTVQVLRHRKFGPPGGETAPPGFAMSVLEGDPDDLARWKSAFSEVSMVESLIPSPGEAKPVSSRLRLPLPTPVAKKQAATKPAPATRSKPKATRSTPKPSSPEPATPKSGATKSSTADAEESSPRTAGKLPTSEPGASKLPPTPQPSAKTAGKTASKGAAKTASKGGVTRAGRTVGSGEFDMKDVDLDAVIPDEWSKEAESSPPDRPFLSAGVSDDELLPDSASEMPAAEAREDSEIPESITAHAEVLAPDPLARDVPESVTMDAEPMDAIPPGPVEDTSTEPARTPAEKKPPIEEPSGDSEIDSLIPPAPTAKKSRGPLIFVCAAVVLGALGAELLGTSSESGEPGVATPGVATPPAERPPALAPAQQTGTKPEPRAAPGAPPESSAAESGAAESSAAEPEQPVEAEPPAQAEKRESPPPGEPGALPAQYGYLVVTSSLETDVYVHGVLVGPTNQSLKSRCGMRFIRLGAPGAWKSVGYPTKIACQQVTTVDINK